VIGYLPGTIYKRGLSSHSCYTKPIIFDVNRCLSYPIENSIDLNRTFNGGPGSVTKINNALVRYVTKHADNILFLDPSDVLCSSNSCLNLINNNNIYIGGNHVTKFFSIYFIEMNKESISNHFGLNN